MNKINERDFANLISRTFKFNGRNIDIFTEGKMTIEEARLLINEILKNC